MININKLKIMLIIFVNLFGFNELAISQILYNGVGHIHPNYQENWTNAGLLNHINAAVRVFNVTSESGTDNEKVESAVAKAKNASASGGISIVYFPEGTYELTYYIQLGQADSNIVFQGDGSDKTFLIFNQIYGDPNFNCFEICGSSGGYTNLTQDIAKGTTLIQGDLSQVASGDWIHFTEYYFDYHPHEGLDLEEKIVGQVTQLLSKNGNAGTIKDEATKDYTVSPYILKLAKVTPIKNVGIENLTIQRLTANKADEDEYGKGHNIKFSFALNCWVKGVESYNPARNHLVVDHSTHMEISGCWFHHAADYGGGGYGYGVCLYGSTTNCLVENNIFSYLKHAMVSGGGANCNVWTARAVCVKKFID